MPKRERHYEWHDNRATLGKFAPLHKGHQLIIDTALAETDHVLVLIYNCPDLTDVPLNVRASWIRDIYPNVEVMEAWDGPLEIGDTPQIKRMHEEYILNTLAGRQITHFYSSEFYGEHVSQALEPSSILPVQKNWSPTFLIRFFAKE